MYEKFLSQNTECPRQIVDNAYIGEPGQFKSQIPFMITAFGDIFVWANDTFINEDYVAYIKIRKGT